MCQFKSGIITTEKVLMLDGEESHTKILEHYKIEDNTYSPNFVRCELIPKSVTNIDFKNVDDWEFKVDQDFLPDWWVPEYEEMRFKKATVEYFKTMTEIGVNAFRNCASLKSIEIPDSVTEISDYAFADCTSLTSVEIPNSVTKIGSWAFECCTSLTSIKIPNSVTQIDAGSFYNCTSLISVEIPNSVTYINDFAFYNCTSLTSVKIANKNTRISEYAFYGCDNLVRPIKIGE